MRLSWGILVVRLFAVVCLFCCFTVSYRLSWGILRFTRVSVDLALCEAFLHFTWLFANKPPVDELSDTLGCASTLVIDGLID